MVLTKPLLIGGAVAAVAAVILFTGDSHAAQERRVLPPVPRPPDLPPPQIEVGPSYYEIPETTVYGDPAAVNFLATTKQMAKAAESAVQSGEGAKCTYSPTTHAFQVAYNQDPTSKHPENVLGSANAIVYGLKEDGLFGQQTATAIWYVTGDLPASLCG
jgi:hypothetical protein